MLGFYSNWTKPFYNKHSKFDEYYMSSFDLLSAIVSSLQWRKHNGDSLMICDKIAAKYYRGLGIESIWNNIDDSLEVPDNISSTNFWAAGKLYAMRKVSTPFIMIDTDFIIWKNIQDILSDKDLVVAHTEPLGLYLGFNKYVEINDTYQYPKDWDWTVNPFNAAVVYIREDEFKNYYLDSAISLMENINKATDHIIPMINVEQRVLAMCADTWNINWDTLIDEKYAYGKLTLPTRTYTHVWGAKDVFRSNPNRNMKFCTHLANIIKEEHSEYADAIASVKQLENYFI